MLLSVTTGGHSYQVILDVIKKKKKCSNLLKNVLLQQWLQLKLEKPKNYIIDIYN